MFNQNSVTNHFVWCVVCHRNRRLSMRKSSLFNRNRRKSSTFCVRNRPNLRPTWSSSSRIAWRRCLDFATHAQLHRMHATHTASMKIPARISSSMRVKWSGGGGGGSTAGVAQAVCQTSRPPLQVASTAPTRSCPLKTNHHF